MVRPGYSKKEIQQFVGFRIRSRRVELKLRQKDLASALDLPLQQVQKYETGCAKISSRMLYALSGFLGVDFDYFFQDLHDVDEIKN